VQQDRAGLLRLRVLAVSDFPRRTCPYVLDLYTAAKTAITYLYAGVGRLYRPNSKKLGFELTHVDAYTSTEPSIMFNYSTDNPAGSLKHFGILSNTGFCQVFRERGPLCLRFRPSFD
jgi:hypothetical protein